MKETLNSNSQLQFQQYQQSNFSHLSPQIIEGEKKILYHLTREIQVLACDRHKNVAGLND